jgi:hypothetical protein
MNKQLAGAVVVAFAGAAFTVILTAQTPATARKEAAAGRSYVVPRTPWGDPDLRGTWSTDDMRAVPMQRPEQMAGRAELNDEEFAKRSASQANAKQAEANKTELTTFGYDVGFRAFRQSSIVVDPPDGRIPPLTPEGQRIAGLVAARRASNPSSWTDRSFYDRCITRGILGSELPVIYGNGNRIAQSPGYVVISYEMVHDTRVVPLDGRPHVGPNVRLYMGDARGHWEGDTLVVETTNFKGNTTGAGPNGGGAPFSDQVRLTERFTRVAADIVDVATTVDDPKTYTRPWTLLLKFSTQPGYQVLPYECHEGNMALRNILSAARAEDKGGASGSWQDGGGGEGGNVFAPPSSAPSTRGR